MTSAEQNSPHPAGAVIGYARTSTIDQQAGLENQVDELNRAGCTRVYQEHVSAVERDRPQLKAALDWLRSGDSFVVTSPDRLARSVTVLLEIVERLRAKGVTVRILSLNLTTGDPTSNLILSLLGSISAWEREVMLDRQRIGIRRAQEAGRYKGRKPTARAKADDIRRLKADGRSIPQIVQETGVSRASVYRALNEVAPASADRRDHRPSGPRAVENG